MFVLKSNFQPAGDQPEAIKKLVAGIKRAQKNQTLLGVTGSGKTFTMASVIERLNYPTLIISHNKTLAGQLYQEMREFFPDNAVSYFVSYYDFYQPEAYIPSSDTYIEKEAQINDLLDKLRLEATTNIMTRKDVIVVASVSCIYNIGSPDNYQNFVATITLNETSTWQDVAKRLIDLQYQRSEYDFTRGTFRVRGNNLDIYPAYQDTCYRIGFDHKSITSISQFDPVSGKPSNTTHQPSTVFIYPAKHYMLAPEVYKKVEKEIRYDLEKEHGKLVKRGKLIEAQRLLQRTNYDLEILGELGYVNGIENYSRYFDGRKVGERPHSLLDYFRSRYQDKWLCIIDESHMTIPQISGMYNGDHARKTTLIEHGFRLRSALDNRPLKFTEFYSIPPHLIYVSATPDEWEIKQSNSEAASLGEKSGVVEQLVRPTGIVDPEIEIRPVENEIQDVIKEIKKRAKNGERTLVTTLTKKTAEDLTSYLVEHGIRASYLHSDIKTLERSDILDKLRRNDFDALIGVNLLREGLDLPEVTLVAILDADKEGFLRSRVSLIQTMGRAARNIHGTAILYADKVTGSMASAIQEIRRRRAKQLAYNRKHGVKPFTIRKPIRKEIIKSEQAGGISDLISPKTTLPRLDRIKTTGLTPYDLQKLVKKLEREMREKADNLEFEVAIAIRNKIRELKKA